MSIFGSILSKIFHSGAEAAPAPSGGAAPAPTAGAGTQSPTPAGSSTPAAPAGAPGTAAATPAPTTGGAPAGVDVAAVLDGLAGKAGEKLDWRHSIVDMMKLLGLDSSLSARKELAKELNYSGDANDSAAMNIWLHKQVMQKLAANGGKVPDDLKA